MSSERRTESNTERRRGVPVARAALLAASLVVTSCVARRTEPIAPPLQLTNPQLVRGQQVFYAECHLCHPHGGAGLGPAIVNKPLPGFLIEFQVRHGLGAMPSFKPDKISSEDLDAVVAYLNFVRANRPAEENVTPGTR